MDWIDFKYRSLWQHPFWEKFQKSIERETWMIKNTGVQALLVKHKMPFSFSWIEIPRGPLFENRDDLLKLLEDIRVLSKKEKAIFVRMSSYQELPISLKETDFDHHPQTSLVIDLNLIEDEILKQMKPKGRYNIKVARKHNVEIKESSDLENFYSLLEKTSGRDGFFIHSKNYYQKLLESIPQHAQLLLAHYDGNVIAGGIFIYLDEWGIYYYGASDHQYRKVMAPYLLQWEAMKNAKKRGCHYYDFLGIAPNDHSDHPWAGVTQFKTKFGGKVYSYPKAKDLVLRPIFYFLYRFIKKLRF